MGCWTVGAVLLLNLAILFFSSHVNAFRLLHGRPSVSTPMYMVKEFSKEQIDNKVDIPKSVNFIDNSKTLATRKDLTIFVLDCSLNGRSSSTGRRIEAVQGAAADIMPRMHVAVVSCFDHGAEVIMKPTSSALVAKRKLPLLQKSFMGNLGQGIHKGLAIAMEYLSSQDGSQVNLVIVADSKAHGLLAGTTSKECEEEHSQDEVCDIELQEEAFMLNQLRSEPNFRCIVIDTEADSESLFAGKAFATTAQAEYIQNSLITRNSIKKVIFRASQGLRKNAPENHYGPSI